MYDAENNWLILIWDEAQALLKNLASAPAWKKQLNSAQKRMGSTPGMSFWKKIGGDKSVFSPSTWQLKRMGYLRGDNSRLWFRQTVKYSDISVFNLCGINIPEKLGLEEFIGLQQEAKALPRFHLQFAYHYTAGTKEDLKQAAGGIKAYRYKEKLRGNTAHLSHVQDNYRSNRAKILEARKANRVWLEAGVIVASLGRLIGRGGRQGRPPVPVTGKKSDEWFEDCISRYMTAQATPQWSALNTALDKLEPLLGQDDGVPPEFGKWTIWRDDIRVLDYIAYARREIDILPTPKDGGFP